VPLIKNRRHFLFYPLVSGFSLDCQKPNTININIAKRGFASDKTEGSTQCDKLFLWGGILPCNSFFYKYLAFQLEAGTNKEWSKSSALLKIE
jgi:hypothetical protein